MSSIETYGTPFKVVSCMVFYPSPFNPFIVSIVFNHSFSTTESMQDLDFANYLGATTELYMNQEAWSAAKTAQFESLSPKKAKRQLYGLKDDEEEEDRSVADGRHLATAAPSCVKSKKGGKHCLQSRWHWALNLYYRPKQYCNEGAQECMFKSEILSE